MKINLDGSTGDSFLKAEPNLVLARKFLTTGCKRELD